MCLEYTKNLAEFKMEGNLHFCPDDLIYKTHYPQCPVVPGSLIVHAFLQTLQQNGFKTEKLWVENFSFREFISPGLCWYDVKGRKGKFQCIITRDGKKMASGVLRYAT